MTTFDRLLGYLHRVFNKDPLPAAALRLTYDGTLTWTIASGVLTTTVTGGTGTNQSIDLSDLTIGALATLLNSKTGYTATLVTSELSARSALVLLDGSGTPAVSNGDLIWAYTSLVWALLAAWAAMFETAKADVADAADQVHLHLASGDYLDVHGDYFGVPRKVGETTNAYRRRLVATILLKRNNNVAIQLALAKQLDIDPDDVQVLNAGATELGDPLRYNGAVNFDGANVFNGRTVNTNLGKHQCEFSVILPASISGIVTEAELIDTIHVFRAAGTRLRKITYA